MAPNQPYQQQPPQPHQQQPPQHQTYTQQMMMQPMQQQMQQPNHKHENGFYKRVPVSAIEECIFIVFLFFCVHLVFTFRILILKH